MRILSEISQCRRFSSHGLSRRRNGALRKELSNLRYSFQGYQNFYVSHKLPISFYVVFVMYFRYLFLDCPERCKISCNHQFQRFEAAQLLLKQRLTNRKVLIANADMISIGPRCALRAASSAFITRCEYFPVI